MNLLLDIPLPRVISLNSIYAGIPHWTRTRHKSIFRDAVYAALHADILERGERIRVPDDAYPLMVHYHFCMARRRIDTSNLAYMVKLLEDGLVHCGVLRDDGPNDVGGILMSQEKISCKHDPYCIVSIHDVKDHQTEPIVEP